MDFMAYLFESITPFKNTTCAESPFTSSRWYWICLCQCRTERLDFMRLLDWYKQIWRLMEECMISKTTELWLGLGWDKCARWNKSAAVAVWPCELLYPHIAAFSRPWSKESNILQATFMVYRFPFSFGNTIVPAAFLPFTAANCFPHLQSNFNLVGEWLHDYECPNICQGLKSFKRNLVGFLPPVRTDSSAPFHTCCHNRNDKDCPLLLIKFSHRRVGLDCWFEPSPLEVFINFQAPVEAAPQRSSELR